MRAACSAQPCAGNGACGAGGACACSPGFGDVGCDRHVPALVPGVLEQHSLAPNDWMYWSLELEDDAAAVIVQLNRTAGDPVLFLKPAGQGFQVCSGGWSCMCICPCAHRRLTNAAMLPSGMPENASALQDAVRFLACNLVRSIH